MMVDSKKGIIDNRCMTLKLILIDIDNTLLDFDGYVKSFLNRHFEGDTEKIYRVFEEVNDALWKRLEKGELTFSHLKEIRWNMILEHLGMENGNGNEMEEMFRKEMCESAIKVDGAEEMLRVLSEDYILATASNGPYEQQVHRIELAGFGKYFDMHFISEDIGYSKPDIRFFKEAFIRINKERSVPIKEKETLIIGDSLSSDMQGGKNAGIHTCFFTRGTRQMEDIQADLIVDSLYEVNKAIRRL